MVEDYEFSNSDRLNEDSEYLSSLISYQNEAGSESVIAWSLEEDDYISSFEYSQLKFEGYIQYHEPRLDMAGNVTLKMSTKEGKDTIHIVPLNEHLSI